MKLRTKLESLKHIKKSLDKGRLGANVNGRCLYRNDIRTKFCGVGCLFSEEQLDDIETRGLNAQSIRIVIDEIGEDNIREVTGMSISELSKIQMIHDECVYNNIFKPNGLKEYIISEIENNK